MSGFDAAEATERRLVIREIGDLVDHAHECWQRTGGKMTEELFSRWQQACSTIFNASALFPEPLKDQNSDPRYNRICGGELTLMKIAQRFNQASNTNDNVWADRVKKYHEMCTDGSLWQAFYARRGRAAPALVPGVAA